jgi:glycosyltransferase involved in cell wall biosynthesis
VLRVLMAIDTYRVSGPAKGLLDFCDAARGRVQPLVVAFQRGPRVPTELALECERRRIPMARVWERFRYDPSMPGRAARVAEAFAPDLLQTHGYKADLVGWRLRRRLRVPWVGWSHGRTDEGPLTRLYHRLGDLVLRRADRVVAVSAARRAALVRLGCSPAKVTTIHNAVGAPGAGPVDVAAVRRELGVAAGGPLLAVVGRLSPEKGQVHFVDAMAAVARARPDVQAVIVGDGQDEAALRAWVTARGLAAAVHFVGYRRDLDRIYRAIDLLVLPSLSEGLPNVVLEAMAHARAVVATRVGGVPEAVDDGVTGVLVPPGDAPALAGAIVGVLADPAACAAMGGAGRARIERDFSVRARADRIVALYAALLRPRRGGVSAGPGLGTRPVTVR